MCQNALLESRIENNMAPGITDATSSRVSMDDGVSSVSYLDHGVNAYSYFVTVLLFGCDRWGNPYCWLIYFGDDPVFFHFVDRIFDFIIHCTCDHAKAGSQLELYADSALSCTGLVNILKCHWRSHCLPIKYQKGHLVYFGVCHVMRYEFYTHSNEVRWDSVIVCLSNRRLILRLSYNLEFDGACDVRYSAV